MAARCAHGGLGGAAVVAGLVLLSAATAFAARSPSVEDLRNLSLEELSNIRVTTVSKTPQRLSRSPAAVYVITAEEIRRSGARTLAEALRLAPNLTVARLNAQSYAITARGFNGFESANKLLVMIDGRSIYSPLHAGVFWNEQQMMLDDIERIEVVSGPGGTLWGANAVNGVVNVITRNAGDTQGALAGARFGNDHRSARARYGGEAFPGAAYRVYGQAFREPDSISAAGIDSRDKWGARHGGFRSDWSDDLSSATLQGDVFENKMENGEVTGGNLLGRWRRELGASQVELQAYYNHLDRRAGNLTEAQRTIDVQAQHVLPFAGGHQVVWGAGYRRNEDELDNRPSLLVLDPISSTEHLVNAFAQVDLALADDLTLILGSKVEHSSFSGAQFLPNARVAWQAAEETLLWAAVSRAARTPARLDRDLVAPFLAPNRNFDSELLTAYELGYRGQPLPRATLSATLYYHDYDDLRVSATDPATGLLTFDNKMHGHGFGLETWADVKVTDWWRLAAGANLMRLSFELEPGAVPLNLFQNQGNDPEYQLSLRSYIDLADDIEMYVGVRAIDSLPSPAVPRYVAVDARLGWQVVDGLELEVVGHNLFDEQHPEGFVSPTCCDLRRSVYVGATVRF